MRPALIDREKDRAVTDNKIQQRTDPLKPELVDNADLFTNENSIDKDQEFTRSHDYSPLND
jgi:hypothetical protein